MSQPYWLIDTNSHPTKIIHQKNPSSKFHTEYTKPTNRLKMFEFVFILKGFMSRQETRPQTRAPKQLNPSNDWANLYGSRLRSRFRVSLEVVYIRRGNSFFTHRKNRMLGATKNIQGRYYLMFCASANIYIYTYIFVFSTPQDLCFDIAVRGDTTKLVHPSAKLSCDSVVLVLFFGSILTC